MFNKLKEKYPNAILQRTIPGRELKHFSWFTTASQKQFIGLPKEELTTNEEEILSLFLEPVTPSSFLTYSPLQSQWHQFLFDYDYSQQPLSNGEEYRLIHFHLSSFIDGELFIEALSHIFSGETTVIFHEQGFGLIIEKKSNFMITLEDLSSSVQILESDFLTGISFFYGKIHKVDATLPQEMWKEQSLFSFALTLMPRNKVLTFEEIFPIYLIKQLSPSQKEAVFSSVQQIFLDEPELLTTIKHFLENQSNVSLTAKQLYMHRNSLQYRIDKFIEKTQIDLRSFKGSLTAYLACIDYELQLQTNKVHKED
ncbi:PucR family transcriptional regulator [Bacillus sp. 2205SS5-2]|uniref:PucR family transcriptional regulator n=1 Tax=Bacillus sp. 2205SS5-2 TaxID=3109031 RepID=UPI003003CDCF